MRSPKLREGDIIYIRYKRRNGTYSEYIIRLNATPKNYNDRYQNWEINDGKILWSKGNGTEIGDFINGYYYAYDYIKKYETLEDAMVELI